MPYKALSTAQGRALWNKNVTPEAEKDDPVAVELKKMYLRLESVIRYIEANGNSGKIILPLPPNLTNKSSGIGHWLQERELKEAYWSHCNAVLWKGLIPKPPKVAPLKVQCKVTLCTSREMDESNANARRKHPEDWLTKNGYIHDDATKHYKVEAEFITVPRVDVRIEFEITEIPE